ncbi:MAG: hypothetical protein ACLPX7_12065 [Xanthobacteraceae bacterium]
MAMKNYDDLAKAVRDAGNVLSCDMGTLRDVHGAGKLGIHVVRNISEELERHGLGHYPEELPQDQWKYARIYKLGTPVARVIRAVTSPDEKSDKVLRDIGGGEANDVLKKIRELVCDE